MKCDFCSSPAPRWRYPASDFDAPDPMDAESVGEWLACDTCHGLVEAGDNGALVERSLYAARPAIEEQGLGFDPEALLPILREFHRRFRLHRHGPAEPLT